MRIFTKILISFMFLFVIWRFVLGIRYNWDLANVRVNVFSSFKQLELISQNQLQSRLDDFVVQWNKFLESYDELFKGIRIEFNDRNFWEVLQSAWNVTIDYTGRIFQLIGCFFDFIFKALWNLILMVVDIIELIIEIVNFILNPVDYKPIILDSMILFRIC